MWKSIDYMRILFVFGLLLAGVCGRTHFPTPRRYQYQSSYNEPNSLTRDDGYRGKVNRDWVKVDLTSREVITVQQGGRFVLECEATGSPSPSIRWIKGSHSLTSFEPGFESSDTRGVGLGKVISRYVVDCALPHDQSSYRCEAVAGSETRVTHPIAVIVERTGHAAVNTVCEKEIPEPAIILRRPIALEVQENDVLLPCRVHGQPTPKITWRDKNEQVVDAESDPRIKVLYNGDLSISRLRWEDMGKYTCVAVNKYGTDSAETFLYPLGPE